jgi:hypothetical protein
VTNVGEQTRANIHALSGIRTHNLIIQALKAYASDRATDRMLLFLGCALWGEPGSSVNIVSGYGLYDRAIEVRSQAEAKRFFL